MGQLFTLTKGILMKIAIKGASGLIGTALTLFLKSQGEDVVSFLQDKNTLEGIDVVINLSGENISSSRWNTHKKKKIYESRVHETLKLVELLNSLKSPPSLFISASAIGYYGSTVENTDETSNPGTGFFASLCSDWEESALRFTKGRVITTRFGIVLSKKGGGLAKMLRIFKMGLGGVISHGKQMMSWISIEDVTRSIYHIIKNDSIKGAVNLTSPFPVSNKEFTLSLGKVLKRPTPFPVPKFLLKLILGQMAEETLLASSSIVPQVLLNTGYVFLYPKITEALFHTLDKKAKSS
jgi:uncharacterized protein